MSFWADTLSACKQCGIMLFCVKDGAGSADTLAANRPTKK